MALLCRIRLLSFILSLWITSFDLSLAQLSAGPSQDFFYILLLIARRAAAAEAIGNNCCLSVCLCAEQKVLQQQSIAFSTILYEQRKERKKESSLLNLLSCLYSLVCLKELLKKRREKASKMSLNSFHSINFDCQHSKLFSSILQALQGLDSTRLDSNEMR